MSHFDTQCTSDDIKKEDDCVPSSSEDSQDGISSPMDNDDEPEFSQKHYDMEPCYYSLTGKSDRNCRGIVYRYRQDSDLKGFQAHDGTLYRLRDSVFVEVSQNEPYVIAAICGFKYTKRDHVVVKLTRYFRADDIPDISLNLMKQERAELEINPHLCPLSLNRELFNSELQLTQPVSCLRGKCIVEYVKDVRYARTVADFSLDNDTFFFCLHYNQDSTKLASTHYAIRVGSSFQASLPPVAKCSVGDEKDRDELLYRPNDVEPDEEQDYIKLARCYRTYTLSGNHMLDSQKNARVSDLLMDEAIIQLHRSGYKIDDALGELNANDIILTTDVDNMTQDDAKKFGKGIRQLGKNFSRIHRELLPHHSREQLVSYYYLWKKTPEATRPKQAARRINPASIKRPTKEKVKASRPTSTEYLDFDSASESDVENNGPSGRACHHCYGIDSKDWHHANGLLLCTECRLHYKKYGQLRHVANRPSQVPACLFKRSNSDEEESGVRTRAGKKEQRRRTPSSMSETPDRRSPSTVSNGAPHLTAEDTPTKRLNGAAAAAAKQRAAKRPLHNGVLNNVDKANSMEPPSPTTPPPTLTNGLTNGHGPGPSTPNGETANKRPRYEEDDDDDYEEGKMTIDEGDDEPMPVLNGFKKEEPEEPKVELTGLLREDVPSTSTAATAVVKEEDPNTVTIELSSGEASVSPEGMAAAAADEDDEPVEPDSDSDTYEVGTAIEIESENASFVRTFIRSCGPRCARTDLHFKFKVGSAWDRAIKKQEEKKKAGINVEKNEAEVKPTQAPVKKEQVQVQQNAQQHAQQQQAHMQHMHQMQMQQLHQAAMLGQLPPEVLRQLMPQQFGVDPVAMLMQQLMHNPQQQGMGALQQQLAIQQQMEHAQIMRMQHEMAQQHQQKMIAEQRNAAAAAAAAAQQREREQREQQRERERLQQQQQAQQQQQQQQQALQQQQQQQALAAVAAQYPPQILQLMASMGTSQQDMARMLEMAAQQQAQAQREQQERERREREQREREQREREQREREAREQAAREQAARDQQASREAQAHAVAAAAAQQNIPMELQQQLLLQHMLMNPALMMQFQQQQQQAQQQQGQAPMNPLQLLHGAAPGQAGSAADMMRRLQAESQSMRPQHQ